VYKLHIQVVIIKLIISPFLIIPTSIAIFTIHFQSARP